MIADDVNQYPITWGAKGFREALARDYAERYGAWPGSIRSATSRLRAHHRGDDRGDSQACRDLGDEVVVFEPFYEEKVQPAVQAA